MNRIFLERNKSFSSPIKWTLDLMARHSEAKWEFVSDLSDADIIFNEEKISTEPINKAFYDSIEHISRFDPKHWLNKESGNICFENGETDLLSTIFYYTNCLQEFNTKKEDLDEYQRFKYSNSIQCSKSNLEKQTVLILIHQWLSEHDIKIVQTKSRLFLSHDIDSMYGSFLQDGFWALKQKNLTALLQVCANFILRTPHWRNIDKMLATNDEFEIKSTFFWLVNNGKDENSIPNADYIIKKESELIELVANHGSVNGIHKSSFQSSISEEISQQPELEPYNRFHFLKFTPQNDWPKLNSEQVKLDVSLGFAEHYGFRNGYGLPFKPFNFDTKDAMTTTIVPLILMDRTLHRYMKVEPKEIEKRIIEFLDQNKYDTVWSILWHNIFYSDYKFGGYLNLLKSILNFVKEENIGYALPNDLIIE